MIFAGVAASDVGIKPIGYTTSMVVTIRLWLVIAPAVGAIAGSPGSKPGKRATPAAEKAASRGHRD